MSQFSLYGSAAGVRRRVTRLVTVAGVIVVLMSGCGGGSAGPADDTATAPAASVVDDSGADQTAGGDGGSGDTATDTSADDEASPATETQDIDDAFATLLGDLPQACTIIDAAEISAIVGADVAASEQAVTDCWYEPSDPRAMTVQVSLFEIPTDDCAFFLQTEPLLPGEEVEPLRDYGELASGILSNFGYEIQVCTADASFTVSVFGDESISPADRAAASGALMDLLLARTIG